ncbi:MAG: hypothetical protein OEV44_13190, partial [Spirochaetota bacterium]|nr:hypothetical protein [Spirochaetota bacterium]
MDGRFRKIDVSNYSFCGGGGIYCNNEHRTILYDIMRDKFGKPNGNSLRVEESTWEYLLEYRGVYVTIYDFGEYWSQGFLELENYVPDYELIFAVSKMLHDFLKQQIELKLAKANEA